MSRVRRRYYMLELCPIQPGVRTWGREQRKENFPSGRIVAAAPALRVRCGEITIPHSPTGREWGWVQREFLQCGSLGGGPWARKSVETQRDLFVVYACLLHVAEVRDGSGFVHRQNICQTKRKILTESAEGDGGCLWIWRRDFRTSMSFLEWVGPAEVARIPLEIL